MRPIINLTGQRFYRLSVLSFSHRTKNGTFFVCQCDCGNIKIIRSISLRKGNTRSCGCGKWLKNLHGGSLNGEDWRQIDNYEGLFEVSNIGRVRRVFPNGETRLVDQEITSAFGYHTATLWRTKTKRSTCHKVHRLVAQAFISNPNNYLQVNHKNGNKVDNRVENLYWGTQKNNIEDSLQHGTFRGFRSYKIAFGGKTKLISQWAREFGMNPRKLYARLILHKIPFLEAVNPDDRRNKPKFRKKEILNQNNNESKL